VFDGKPFHTLITRLAKNKLRTDLLPYSLRLRYTDIIWQLSYAQFVLIIITLISATVYALFVPVNALADGRILRSVFRKYILQ